LPLERQFGRHRLALVTRFLRDEQPDVLCLQETKVEDGLFPARPSASWVRPPGDPRPEGLSRGGSAGESAVPRNRVQDFCRTPCPAHGRDPGERGRAAQLYVPAGGDIPDPKANDNSPTSFTSWPGWKNSSPNGKPGKRPGDPGGDLNVAPLETMCGTISNCWASSATHRWNQTAGRGAAAFDWIDTTPHFHSAGGKNLQLVELSARRLGGVRPRSAAGSCLGQSG